MSDWNEDFKQDEQDQQLPANTRVVDPDLVIAQRSRDMLDNLPTGAPPQQYDVRSIYDSRPINATDFNLSISNFSAENAGGVWNGNFCDFTFTVPNGYVAVLRELHHSFTPPPVIAGRSEVTASFLINGALYQQPVQFAADNLGDSDLALQTVTDIPIGLESDDILQGFVIADQGQTLGVRIKVTAAIAAVEPVCHAHLYGQLLQKTGRPAQFEIANPSDKVFVGNAIYTPPATAPIERPVAAPVVEREVRQQQQVLQAPQEPQKRALRSASAGRKPIYDRKTGKIVRYE